MERLEGIGLLPSHAHYVSRSRLTALVDSLWLESAISGCPKAIQNGLKHPEEYLHRSSPDPPPPWHRVSIKVLTKQSAKVQRSAEFRVISHRASYCDLMGYIAEENYRNQWECAWEQYTEQSAGCIRRRASQTDGKELQDYNTAVESILNALYGSRQSTWAGVAACCLEGVQPACAVFQTEAAYYVVQPFARYSLRELQAFSPAALGTSSSHLMFIFYQLLRLAHGCHSRGVALGVVSDDQVLVTGGSEGGGGDECFWVSLTPRICRQLVAKPVDIGTSSGNESHAPERSQPTECVSALETWCCGWTEGTITNFDYLMFLNKLAGRRIGDPNHHPVLPWVMDFTAQDSGYRDLCKSKFRLNKGDEQLDQMYTSVVDKLDSGDRYSASAIGAELRPPTCDGVSVTTPHHVSAVLSDITYYTYMARRTPRDVLCAHVRPKWVPNEYPASVERLQAWTPDECIPEFFTDATIFSSIHNDLPDLKVPSWADTPERFIELHMQALESEHISQSLHHWIDLTFGYKLRGEAAVEAKNVCLQLVDGHRHPENHGIVQLFARPHPARLTHSPKSRALPRPSVPPYLRSCMPITTSQSSQSLSSIMQLGSEPDPASGLTSESFASSAAASGPVVLPDSYDPLDILERAERAWHSKMKPSGAADGAKEVGSRGKIKDLVDLDMMGIGCIVVKAIFPVEASTIVCSGSDEANVAYYYRKLQKLARRRMNDIPRPLLSLVQTLMNTKNQRSDLRKEVVQPMISSEGLPPPCPGLLLHPVLQAIPFPTYYCALYDLICTQKRMETAIAVAARLAEREKWSKASIISSITSFCDDAVRTCLKMHITFFNEHGSQLSAAGLELVMPYVLKLLRCEEQASQSSEEATAGPTWLQRQRVDYAVQAAWTLFPYVSQVLGPQDTYVRIVPALVKLYDLPCKPLRTVKCIKLYHKSFVQQLCTQLGLEAFLAAGFVHRLAQGVAGFRDYSAAEDLLADVSQVDAETSQSDDGGDGNEDDVACDANDANEGGTDMAEEAEECGVVELSAMIGIEDIEAAGTLGDSRPDRDPNSASEFQPVSFALDNGETFTMPLSSTEVPGSETGDLPRQQIFRTAELGPGEEYNVRHVAGDCMSWLCERLGPVIAVRHASEALLLTLKDCYGGTNSLDSVLPEDIPEGSRLFMSNKYVEGDVRSAGILRCLGNMAVLYGEQFVLLRYFYYVIYLVQSFDVIGSGTNAAAANRSAGGSSVFPRSLESGLLACVTLLSHLVTFLSDTKLLEVLEKSVMKDMLTPLIQTVASCQKLFSSGHACRSLATFRIVDVMTLVSVRVGFDQTRQYMCSVLKLFFSSFNVHSGTDSSSLYGSTSLPGYTSNGSLNSVRDGNEYVQIKQSAVDRNDFYIGSPVTIAMSPAASATKLDTVTPDEPVADEIADELRAVFSPELAQYSYVKFCKLAGGIFLQKLLTNEELVSHLSAEYDEQTAAAAAAAAAASLSSLVEEGGNQACQTTWFVPVSQLGAEPPIPAAEVIGNKLSYVVDKTRAEPRAAVGHQSDEIKAELLRRSEMVTDSFRHLKGNWLAYCEHEWGLDKNDTAFKFKQIHLQDFVGHAASVRSMQVLENENSFITGSKDRTVKLWSLRNTGDGTARAGCQYTYTGHKRTVLSVAYMESVKLVASLDGSVHLWDPFFGACVSQYEVSRFPSDSAAPASSLGASAIRPLFAPSPLLVAATAESTLRLLDVRVCRFAHEFKVWQHHLASIIGTVNGLAVGQNNNCVAVASTSGYVCTLDLRTGFPLGAWKAHDGEILQIRSFNDKCFITSSMDTSVMMWRYDDPKTAVCSLKGHTDPVRCIQFHNTSMISATTANKIGIHSSVGTLSSFHSEKLRADTFKGVLTSMAVLRLNKLLVFGADNGMISLFA